VYPVITQLKVRSCDEIAAEFFGEWPDRIKSENGAMGNLQALEHDMAWPHPGIDAVNQKTSSWCCRSYSDLFSVNLHK
jgi:hypothetical protein